MKEIKKFKSDPAILPQPLEVGWPITGFMQLIQDHKCVFAKNDNGTD